MTSQITDLTVNPGTPTILDNKLLDISTKPLDRYRLNITRSSSARLILSDLKDDVNLRVFREGSTTAIADQKNSGSLSEVILLDDLAVGSYIVEVYLPETSGVGSYDLKVEVNTEAQQSNLWWRNSTTGQVGIWEVQGVNQVPGKDRSYNVPINWQVVAHADLDADGQDDVVWRNMTSGEVTFWLLQGTEIKAENTTKYFVGLDWQIIGVDDLSGDGRADLIWENRGANGTSVGLWLMNGADRGINNAITVPREWRPHAILDANGDTKADIFWRNTASGQTGLWLMDGAAIAKEGPRSLDTSFPLFVPLDWNVEQIGDFNDDGVEDLLWRQTGTGSLGIWLMDALNRPDTWGVAAPANWSVRAVGDFDGVGSDDILWSGPGGQVGVWYLADNGKSIKSTEIATTHTGFTIAGVGDFNNDLITDIVYNNLTTGTAKIALVRSENGRLREFDSKDHPTAGGWGVRSVIDRQVKNAPFEISGDLPTEWFDLGTLNDSGVYKDKVQAGEFDFFRFNTAVRTNLTIKPFQGVKFDVARLQRDQAGNLNLATLNVSSLSWTTLGANELILQEPGDWVVRVSTSGVNQAITPYTMDITGVPQITNIVGTRFSIDQGSIALTPSANQTPNTPNPNLVNVTFSIKNTGSSKNANGEFSITNFNVGFWLSLNDQIQPGNGTPDQRLQVRTTTGEFLNSLNLDLSGNPLLAGESRKFTATLRLPDTANAFWFVDGTHFIGMELDESNRIPEDREDDNFNQAVVGRDKAQLQITGTEFTDLTGAIKGVTGSRTPGSTITINFDVKNLGNKATTLNRNIPVQFILSADPDINRESFSDTSLFIVRDGQVTVDDTFLITPGSSNSSAIAGGATVPGSVTLKLPDLNSWGGWLDENGEPRTTFYLGMLVNLGSSGDVERNIANNEPGDVTNKPDLADDLFVVFRI